MNLHFYHCNVCGKTIAVLSKEEIPTVCCGLQMEELIPGTADGAAEKHVPAAAKNGDLVQVKVGAAAHPMTEDHSIQWIGLSTKKGFQFKELTPQNLPMAEFSLISGDDPGKAFSYCNIHGLWCADVPIDM